MVTQVFELMIDLYSGTAANKNRKKNAKIIELSKVFKLMTILFQALLII